MKKLLSILLSAILIFSILTALPFSAGAYELKDFKYDLLANDTIVITDYKGNDKEITIPGKIDGHLVSTIGEYSFAFNKTLESVVVPKSVISIGFMAFSEDESLRKIEIPESVTTIRQRAFNGCHNLADIKLPSNIRSIEYGLFTNCENLKSINIPQKVIEIGDEAFANCSSLESIEIPDDVRSLGYDIFNGCSSLKSAKLGKNISTIPSRTFAYNKALTKISIHNKITTIGNSAFFKSGLEKVLIGKNIKKIGDNSFNNCVKLKSITVDKKNKSFSGKSGVLYNKKKTKLITYPGGKTDKKFTSLKTVAEISNRAFCGNYKLKTVKLNKGLKTIGKYAFYESKVKNVNFPSTLRKIKEFAFMKNDNLESITIPKNVTLISEEAFCDCDGLKKLSFKENGKLNLGYKVFSDCSALQTVKYPVMKSSEGYTFSNCGKLKKVIISKNVRKIFRKDFTDCPNLNKITIPKTVKSIENRALGYINEYDYQYDKNYNLIIYGEKKSTAYKYAKKNGFTFKKIKK